MKKFVTVVIATVLALVLSTTFEHTSKAAEMSQQPVLPEKEVAFDMDLNEPQEQKVFDDNGKYVGTLGIIPEETKDEFSTMGTYPVPVGTTTFKIYWNTGVVNLSYRIKVNRPKPKKVISYSKITKAWDEWHFVTPPFTVQDDELKITKAQETSKAAATARYRLKYGILGQGSIHYDLKSKVSKHYLYTSVSSFG
ncbi:DUF5626 family protein [Bacillus nakamurai]|uniref:DUF5626 family protein n=1 Tax=Bacillus nakamurai TaxID=1793963 RepID=UPI001E2DD811|nr:DUF5626 family protein [Bacillus nakamurai]MCC9023040.1 DUF5626 family protein [Bacillus nakamurai]